jgi:uridine kinase
MNSNSIIICIAGASGSGKTTFAKKLISALPKKETLLITQDAYYKDLSSLSLEERANQNFDHPDSLDFELLKKHIIELIKGNTTLQPIYDFNTHSRLTSSKKIEPEKIIIIEGTLVLSQEILLEFYDLNIYIDLDQKACLSRRIERDIAERGRTKASVLEQYNQTVKPMFKEFILPSKGKADLIIPGENINASIQTVIEEIKKIENNLQ